MRKLIIVTGLFATVLVVALVCGCQYAHVEHQKNVGVHPIKDIFTSVVLCGRLSEAK